MATREGVEKVKDMNKDLPASDKQKEMIAEILSDFPNTKTLFEYEDYLENSTRENASQYISAAMEHNIEKIMTKKNYVHYIANRPGVEKLNENGMFTDENGTVALKQLAEEVGNHQGNVWTHIISLRREDAVRLGYDSAKAWINLCRSKRNEMAKQMSIDPKHLKWYAAFHNEGHHPHIHMIVYSTDDREGYVTKNSIINMRSSFANEIFKQDLIQIYKGQTVVRDNLKEVTKQTIENLIRNMNENDTSEIKTLLLDLKQTLQSYTGKKVYGYLPKTAKAIVNKIIDCLEQDENIKQLLDIWYMKKDDIHQTYQDETLKHYSLSNIPEFKSLKNTVIKLVSEMDTFLLQDGESSNDKEMTLSSDDTFITTEPYQEFSKTIESFKMEWSDDYKEAMKYLYGSNEVGKDFEKALELLEIEAEKGNVLAIYELANMYEKGIGTDKNSEIATPLYQKALKGFTLLEHGSKKQKEKAYLNYRLGKIFLYGQGIEKDYMKALNYFEKAPHNIYALYNLGCMYQRGLGVGVDYQSAYDYFIKSKENPYSAYAAAELLDQEKVISNESKDELYSTAYQSFDQLEKESHDDNLQYRLGKMNFRGKGTEQDIEKAIDYLEDAVKLENVNAKFLLAKIYLSQNIIEKIPIAMKWLEELAEENAPYICNLLASEYKKGNHVEADIDKAIHYFMIGAEQGDAFAQYGLYMIYFHEIGYIDVPLGLQYLEKVAYNGYDLAQYHLGKYYLQGEVIEKNITIALDWLEKSASQGNQFAQCMLGKLFLFGIDVEKDKEKAIDYLNEAANQGNEFAIHLLDHMNDYYGQPISLLVARLIHHIQNTFTNHLLPDSNNPLLHTDRKLRAKLLEKRAALGHKENDHSAFDLKH